jgi:hypothetical protein
MEYHFPRTDPSTNRATQPDFQTGHESVSLLQPEITTTTVNAPWPDRYGAFSFPIRHNFWLVLRSNPVRVESVLAFPAGGAIFFL